MPIVVMPDGMHVDMPDQAPADVATPKPSTLSQVWDAVKSGIKELPSIGADALRSGSKYLNDVAAHNPLLMTVTGGKGAPALQQQADKGTDQVLPMPTGDSTGRQYLRKAVEGAVPAIMTAGEATVPAMVKSGLVGLTSGVGGEAADKLSNGNPVARTLGSIITGLATGAGINRVGASKPNQVSLAKEAVEGLPPEALEKASAFQAQSAAKGLNLDLAQALSAVGVPEQNLTTLRNYLANSKAGNTTQKILREQPSQLSTVADTAVGGLPGKVLEDGVAANNLANAATKTVTLAKQARSDATTPLYEAAGNLPSSFRSQIANTLTEALSRPGIPSDAAGKLQDALASLKSSPGTGSAMSHAKDYDQLIRELSGPYKGQPLSGTGSAFLGDASKTLRDQLREAAPELKQAAALHAQISTDVVDPLKQGPVGQIAGRRGYLSDVQTPVTRMNGIFSRGSDPQAPTSAITTLGEELNKSNSQAFADAAKTYYSGKVAESFKPTFGAGEAANADAAGKLVTNLFNDSKQWQGMKDTATVIAKGAGLDPAAVVKGLETFGQMVKGAANRPGTVSGLNPADIVKIAGNSNLATVGKSVGLAPTKPFAIKLEDATLQKTLSQFDRILTTPDGARMLAELAKTGVMSPEAKSLLQSFTASQGSASAPAAPASVDYGYGKRQDGSNKGQGFLGPLKRPDGSVSTEITVGVNIGGKETEIPTLVPTLTETEKQSLLRGDRPSDAIVQKAVDHAKARKAAGKSVFADN